MISAKIVQKLYHSPKNSHKGENGRLLIIGGSHLFHGASLWAIQIASRIVDMVFYHSIPLNRKIALKIKAQLLDFIVVPQNKLANYLTEADVVLIGPGLPRQKWTKTLTERFLKKYPQKQWVVDAGSLQMMRPALIPKNAILLPHAGEFKKLFGLAPTSQNAQKMAKKHRCVILLKGPTDYICSAIKCETNQTGNEGMTKGGTGDVLAGLVAAFACKNDPFLSAGAAAFVNGLAGDRLKKRVSIYFNASDLANEIPATLKWCLEQ